MSLALKRTLKLLVSLAVTGGCLAWFFKDTDWNAMRRSLVEANYGYLLPYLGILLLIHLCRTLRWGCWLSSLEKVPFRALNEASGIGFMMLIVLPFRLGEFARPFLIAQRTSIRRSAAMTSVVLERIVDGIVIAAMLRGLLLFVPAETPEVRYAKWGANLLFLVFGGGLGFLLFGLWQRQRAVGLLRATVGRLSPRLADQVSDIVDRFVGAVRMLPGPAQLVGFVAFTAGYWLLNGWGMWLLAQAFALPVTVFQSFVVLAVLVVGLMIPAAPGSAGTFQVAVAAGLQVFIPDSVVSGPGAAYANVLWAVQIFQQIGLGLVLMWASNASFSDIAGKLGRDDAAPAG